MNEKETLVEMTGIIVKEALKEIADKDTYIDTLRDENSAMRREIEELEECLKRIKGIVNAWMI